MRRALLFALSASLPVIMACDYSRHHQDSVQPKNAFVLDTFAAETEGNIRVEHQDGPDFFLINFLDSGTHKILLRAYVGGSPNFLKSIHGHEDSIAQKETGDAEVKTVAWGAVDSRSCDVLMKRKDCLLAGQFHLWYRDLSAEQARKADELISSVHYNEQRVNELKQLQNAPIEGSR